METPISIVVSTFNRINYLKRSIQALLNLDYQNFEIIVVNDGSRDGTKNYLKSLKNEKIKIIHHKRNLGLSRARNSGIKLAQGNIIAFTDDDCVAAENWLRALAKSFANPAIGFVIGQTFYIKESYQGYFPERLVQNIGAHWPMGCNIAYRKSVFAQIGYFRDQFFKYHNEDSEMALRAVAAGIRFNRCLEAIVYHQAAEWTVESLLKSARNAAVWPILKKKYPYHYLAFNPPIKKGIFISPQDYLYIFTAPALIPLLLLRYLIHGKRDLKLFFAKWPAYLFLKRFYIYQEAAKNRVFMI